jgi:pyruvate formate-lyase/glycerol dehydratase family glycyl radical enzyme
MYKFRPATDRIKYMRELIRDRVIRNDAERMMIITDAYKKNENVVPIIKRPLALLELCKRMSIIVEDFEVIVGNKGPHYFSSVQYPEWGVSDWVVEPIKRGEWTLREDGLYHNPDNEEIRLTISPEDYEYISENLEYWKTRKVGSVADAWQPEYFQELKRLNVSSYAEGGMSLILLPAGHLVAGYEKIINTGYAAIRKQAQDWIDSHYGNLMGEDIDKYMFYKSAVITCDAATTLIRRYAARCAEKALTEVNPKRKKELEMMADGLEWLSENPARTFWEAVQGVMMYQVLIQIESLLPSPALGRFDQYTWPFLKRDLEEGRITLDEAQEIVDAFFLKANCFYGGGPSKLTNTTGIGNTYQHTTIGGVDPDTGEDACNPVTYMVLETVGRLKLHDPTISLRFNKNSPDSIWELALETSKLVGGLPLYQNDEVIIPALMDQLGFSLRDARDYGIIGCQEIVGCGNDYPAPNGMHPPHASVWWGSIFNMAINNGINPFNGEQASLKTGYLYEMTSIDQVKQAVEAMGRHIMRMFVSTNNYAEYLSQYYAPQAILSISIDGCMEKGKDVVAGGAKYNSYGGTATGLATLADSLSTIKYMCFDKKLISTRELYDAWINNWEGYEVLRQRILSEVPHYGNADPYVDEELKWCVDLYYRICQEFHSKRSKVYKCGLYGASDHIAQGYITFATPDGRRTGEPLADAMSPAQGRDKNGPTAVFESTTVFDHHHYLGGIALNLRLHPSVLSNESGIAKVRDMTKNYFENGGLEVQYNVVDTETLRAAQKDPSSYRDLVVRIAGYSAYFVELGVDLQNDIISRNENYV